MTFIFLGQPVKALSALEQAKAMLDGKTDLRVRGYLMSRLAQTYIHLGN